MFRVVFIVFKLPSFSSILSICMSSVSYTAPCLFCHCLFLYKRFYFTPSTSNFIFIFLLRKHLFASILFFFIVSACYNSPMLVLSISPSQPTSVFLSLYFKLQNLSSRSVNTYLLLFLLSACLLLLISPCLFRQSLQTSYSSINNISFYYFLCLSSTFFF